MLWVCSHCSAKVNAATLQDKETSLHMAASYSPLASPPELVADMLEVATKLLHHPVCHGGVCPAPRAIG